MAQNITWPDGTQLANVPALVVPKTGGGTARFTDTSGVTAEDEDVAAGKIYVKSNGELSTGTASGGSAVIEALNVTANGVYTAPSGVDGYSPVTVNVSGGGGAVSESDVNFYDYDGTLVASRTKAEINAMSSDSDLPANPTHSGLTSQGWNWSLAQLKTQLTAMPDQAVNVGQMYVTDDDKTRIYVHFEQNRTSPYLGICPKGTVTIDWGDGSSTSTLTGTSLTTVKTVQHTYAAAGDYVIKLTAASGTTFAFYGTSTGTNLLMKTSSPAIAGRVYSNAVQKVELGSAAQIGNYAFYGCWSLSSITIPSGVTSISQYAFYYGYSLFSITIPSTVTSIGNNAFRYCYSLFIVTVPPSVTSIFQYLFQNDYALAKVTIPSTVTSIGKYALQGCSSLSSITIPSGVTSLGSYAFSNCFSLFSIAILSSITSIAQSTFSGCNSLVSLTIPSTVTSIAENAFNGGYGLAEIHFKPTTPPTVANSNAWNNIPTDCKIYVPTGSLSAYTSATNYPSSSTYTYIEE